MEGHQEKMFYRCRICGHEVKHRVYQVKEMFYGTEREFTYFGCDKCQCIQIAEAPENLGEFYGKDYYSFSRPQVREPETDKRIETRILDVGCGAGKWLAEKYAEGHVNLFGCDPFVESDISYGKNIYIKKCSIHEMEGCFDLIRMHDSFEHMGDPLAALASMERLMSREGMALISIPVVPNAACDIFGTSWYQWDAPRHLFLHSVKSMEFLCSQVGLRIEDIAYNSDYRQFISSLLYQQGIPLIEQSNDLIASKFSRQQMEQFVNAAKELNQKGYGDHAMFVIRKNIQG